MDLTIPLILAVGYVAVKLSKKEPRTQENPTNVESSIGSNLYSSRDTLKNQQALQKKSDERYEKAKNPMLTGIIPELFNTACDIDCPETSPSVSSNTVLPSLGSGKLTDKEAQILTGPMFRQGGNVQGSQLNSVVFDSNFKPTKEGFSDLAGTPVSTAMNLQPFFGGSVKQNTNTDTQSVDVLGLFSGTSELYKKKQESAQFFAPVQQNIYGNAYEPDHSRYIQSNLKTNLLPGPQTKEAPINALNTRVNPKTGDELYVNPKQSYQGRHVDGLKGETRGVFADFKRQGPETFYDNSSDRYIVATGQTVQKSRGTFVNGKEGLSETPLPLGQIYDPQSLKNSVRLTKESKGILGELESLVNPDKRTTDTRQVIGNARGSNNVVDLTDIEKYIVREQERATTNLTYIGGNQTNQRKPVIYSNEGARETCKVEIVNHMNTPERSKLPGSRLQYDNMEVSCGKEQISDLQSYMLKFEEKTKLYTSKESVPNVQLKSDAGRETLYEGHRVNKITGPVTQSSDLGEKMYREDYKELNRLEDSSVAAEKQKVGNDTYIKRF